MRTSKEWLKSYGLRGKISQKLSNLTLEIFFLYAALKIKDSKLDQYELKTLERHIAYITTFFENGKII